jgi:DNA-binding protein H-NS
MRANVRPFAREYKSRSSKTMLQSSEKKVDLVIAARRSDELQKEAEAIFRRDEVALSASHSDGDVRMAALSAGRILPCLLSTPSSSDSANYEKASSARRINALSSAKALVKPRLKKSRETHLPVGSERTQSIPWSPSMSDEFVALSDLEILSLIERAKTELVHRKEAGKELLRAEIEAKLKNAGLNLGDLFESERKTTRGADKAKDNNGQSIVAAKYKNHLSGETWSGRGRSPKWVVAILQEREWSVEEFKRSDEFVIA